MTSQPLKGSSHCIRRPLLSSVAVICRRLPIAEGTLQEVPFFKIYVLHSLTAMGATATDDGNGRRQRTTDAVWTAHYRKIIQMKAERRRREAGVIQAMENGLG